MERTIQQNSSRSLFKPNSLKNSLDYILKLSCQEAVHDGHKSPVELDLNRVRELCCYGMLYSYLNDRELNKMCCLFYCPALFLLISAVQGEELCNCENLEHSNPQESVQGGVWPCLTMVRLCRRSTYLVLSNRPRNRTRLFTSHLVCGCILPQWRSQRHFFELSGKQGSCVLGAFQVHTPNVFMQKWCEHSLTKVLFENLIGMFRNGRWASRQISGV